MLGQLSWTRFLFSTEWYPTSHSNVRYGTLALLVGTGSVTILAMLMAVPLGLGAAIFVSEFCSRKLKEILDGLMSPADSQHRTLRVSEVLEILDFLMLSFAANSSERPKSRQYLDWLCAMAGMAAPPPESSRLILP